MRERLKIRALEYLGDVALASDFALKMSAGSGVGRTITGEMEARAEAAIVVYLESPQGQEYMRKTVASEAATERRLVADAAAAAHEKEVYEARKLTAKAAGVKWERLKNYENHRVGFLVTSPEGNSVFWPGNSGLRDALRSA